MGGSLGLEVHTGYGLGDIGVMFEALGSATATRRSGEMGAMGQDARRGDRKRRRKRSLRRGRSRTRERGSSR